MNRTTYLSYEERQEALAIPEVAARAKQLDRRHTRVELISMLEANPFMVVNRSGSIYSLKSFVAETVAIVEFLTA